MTSGIVQHRTAVITPQMVTAASLLVRIAHTDDASLARALGKAEQRLMDLAWTVNCGILQIASYSHPTDINSTDGTDCSCPTSRGTCYHKAAWFILSSIAAAGINPIAPIPLPLAALDEDIDDYPGDFLSSLADEDTHDEYGDVLPLAPPAFVEVDELPAPRAKRVPFRVPSSRVLEPAAGSDFARAQALADELFAA